MCECTAAPGHQRKGLSTVQEGEGPRGRKASVVKPGPMDSGGETAEGLCVKDWGLCFPGQARISKSCWE